MDIYRDDDGILTHEQTDLLTRVVEATVEYASIVNASEVSISFVSVDDITALNRDYRGIDSATDVLSFPVSDGLATGAGRPLGDVVICINVARLQAEEYGHSFERELAFLVVHGMLHLLGYDHETPEDEIKMRAAQDTILQDLNIIR